VGSSRSFDTSPSYPAEEIEAHQGGFELSGDAEIKIRVLIVKPRKRRNMK
jgi:hypothetical protein